MTTFSVGVTSHTKYLYVCENTVINFKEKYSLHSAILKYGLEAHKFQSDFLKSS